MPISLLIALLIAFGADFPELMAADRSVGFRLCEVAAGILAVALLAFGLGGWVTWRVAHLGYATPRILRRYTMGTRLLTVLSLGIFAWIIHRVGWSELVLARGGLQGSFLLDDLAVFSPFIVIQLIIWWGLYLADRALHTPAPFPGLATYLARKVRQAVGLVLPILLIFLVRQDLFSRLWPSWHQTAAAEPLEMAAMGLVVFVASPLFIRLAWPTRSLPEGPLRRRLERVAHRVGFRFTDLLVWDTGNLMVNGCVTGVLPWFRYVLLSDALIESLSPAEVAAVFGHEVGHVAHRHLPFFGFFFLGCLAILSLSAQVFSVPEAWIEGLPWLPAGRATQVGEIAEAAMMLGTLGLFFWLVFGHLSRRFERQADVFGCRVVSCGVADCPPHFDLEEEMIGAAAEQSPAATLCPVGIQIFSEALASVARQNGIDARARSWRHGSIANRLAFLRQLQSNPAGEVPFQKGVRWYRLVLTVVLLLALVFAIFTRSWELLR